MYLQLTIPTPADIWRVSLSPLAYGMASGGTAYRWVFSTFVQPVSVYYTGRVEWFTRVSPIRQNLEELQFCYPQPKPGDKDRPEEVLSRQLAG
jgi:hypothetical protein